MNKVCLVGRLTANAELRYTQGNAAYTRFNLAVNRSFANENGEREADFISCIAWRKTAELINKYFEKGSQIGLEGRIQTGNYQNEKGDTIYTTDIVVENITFLDSKQRGNNPAAPAQTASENDPFAGSDPFTEFGETVSIDDNFLE